MNLQTESNKSFWVHTTLHSHLTSTSTMWFVWKKKLKYPLLYNKKNNTGDVITFETQYCILYTLLIKTSAKVYIITIN